MTTLYEFCVGYTKLGVGAAPSSAPTITVVDSANNVLVSAATATTALGNLVGAYRYSYSGADGLICYAKFTTTDLTMDQYEIFTAALINPVVRDIQTMLTDIHATDLPAVKTDTAAIKLKTDNLPSDPADESLLEAAIAALSVGAGLDAAGVRAALGMAAANLDAQLANILASGGAGSGAITWPYNLLDALGALGCRRSDLGYVRYRRCEYSGQWANGCFRQCDFLFRCGHGLHLGAQIGL